MLHDPFSASTPSGALGVRRLVGSSYVLSVATPRARVWTFVITRALRQVETESQADPVLGKRLWEEFPSDLRDAITIQYVCKMKNNFLLCETKNENATSSEVSLPRNGSVYNIPSRPLEPSQTAVAHCQCQGHWRGAGIRLARLYMRIYCAITRYLATCG
jgi:hypothetical protein